MHRVIGREYDDGGSADEEERRLRTSPANEPHDAGARCEESNECQFVDENTSNHPWQSFEKNRAPAVGKQPCLKLPPEHDLQQIADRCRRRLDVRVRLLRAQQDEAVLQQARGHDGCAGEHGAEARGERAILQNDEQDDTGRESEDGGVVAETRGKQANRHVVPHGSARLGPREKREDDARQNGGVERVDLGDDGLRPEHVAERESERYGGGDDTAAPQLSRNHEDQRHGDRPEEGGKQVQTIGKRPDGQVRKRMRDQDVEGITGVVSDAEHAPDELKHRGVYFGDQTRSERPNVDEKGAHADGRSTQPVCSRRARLASREPSGVVRHDYRVSAAVTGPSLRLSSTVRIQPARSTYPNVESGFVVLVCFGAHPRDVHEVAMAAAANRPVVAVVRKRRRECVDGRRGVMTRSPACRRGAAPAQRW